MIKILLFAKMLKLLIKSSGAHFLCIEDKPQILISRQRDFQTLKKWDLG